MWDIIQYATRPGNGAGHACSLQGDDTKGTLHPSLGGYEDHRHCGEFWFREKLVGGRDRQVTQFAMGHYSCYGKINSHIPPTWYTEVI